MKDEFIKRTSLAWGVSVSTTEQLLNTTYATIIRINPLRVRKSTLNNIKKNFKTIHKIDWVDNAYSVANGKVRASEMSEFENGEFIIQNSASFIPVLELHPKPNETILDMCAAPGGKSSHIAALTNNKAKLVLNDTSRTRFFKMKKLMQTMGVEAEYCLKDGRYLTKEYGVNSFDKVLLDAPCSGEANIKLDILINWNTATIKRLYSLQSKLLQEAFDMLKPGGRLVYSTCTIAPEENELVVDSLLKHNLSADIIQINDYPLLHRKGLTEWSGKQLDARIKNTLRLLPSSTCKPFYIAVITKNIVPEDDSYQRMKYRTKYTK